MKSTLLTSNETEIHEWYTCNCSARGSVNLFSQCKRNLDLILSLSNCKTALFCCLLIVVLQLNSAVHKYEGSSYTCICCKYLSVFGLFVYGLFVCFCCDWFIPDYLNFHQGLLAPNMLLCISLICSTILTFICLKTIILNFIQREYLHAPLKRHNL